MSFLSQAWMLDKYGPRISMKDLAGVLGIAHGTLRNRLSNGKLSVKTYTDGGVRYADYRDVSEYLDSCRAETQV